MDLMILNDKFESFSVLDDFTSFIWTDRYSAYGDFEIYIAANKDNSKKAVNDYYLYSPHSEHTMIIESITLESDADSGDFIKMSGRSLESILTRRIIWNQTVLNGKLQNVIEKLLIENVIEPTIPERKINNFIFNNVDDEYINGINIEAQFTGEEVYTAIKKLCDPYNVGFKIILDDQNNFVFSLYHGVDRSFNQVNYPSVIFSPNFENIISGTYLRSNLSLKNVALVGGEGEGSKRKLAVTGLENLSGIIRREMFVDARDLSSDYNGETLTNRQYTDLLKTRGNSKLSDNKFIEAFDGELETSQLYKYQNDFFMGDVVEFENGYGVSSKVRIVEYIYSEESSGIKAYPTFEVLEESLEGEGWNKEWILSSQPDKLNLNITEISDTITEYQLEMPNIKANYLLSFLVSIPEEIETTVSYGISMNSVSVTPVLITTKDPFYLPKLPNGKKIEQSDYKLKLSSGINELDFNISTSKVSGNKNKTIYIHLSRLNNR